MPAEAVDASPGALVIAYDRDSERARSTQVFATLALMSAIALVTVAVVGWFLAGRLLAPIRRLDETARRITDSDLTLRIPVTGSDDLAGLTVTVNAMLDRLERVFRSQRTLLDDVGHELRTPLTIVRGHLELMDPHDPADARAARDVALSELARMSRLVDDLMTLATVDRPDFVRPTPVDVGRLTDDLLDTVHTLAPRRWLVDARADGLVALDAQRITQAVVQLTANAVRHTTTGATVALGSAIDADGACRVWVRDEGEGIAAAEQGRIFDRFHRGASRTSEGGSGIGLSIVAAIATAHGGEVLVTSAPGRGSTFTLRIPGARASGVPSHDLHTGAGRDPRSRRKNGKEDHDARGGGGDGSDPDR